MTTNRTHSTNMNTRQKVIAGIIAIILVFVLWQVIGMFRGESSSSTTPMASLANKPQTSIVQKTRPVTAETLTPREKQLLQLQEETQARYLDALNQLQLLKISKDIAETNQAIATAKLSTVESEKKILDIVTPPAPPSTPAAYAKNLVNPGQAPNSSQPINATPAPNTTNFSVISVSKLQNKWNAVIGAQGNLYNVHVGDVLPNSGAKVVRIDNTGVILELTSGEKQKISLIPII